jgi:hypothetical protein
MMVIYIIDADATNQKQPREFGGVPPTVSHFFMPCLIAIRAERKSRPTEQSERAENKPENKDDTKVESSGT